jgi:putative membrane protein insertion efficiency factor
VKSSTVRTSERLEKSSTVGTAALTLIEAYQHWVSPLLPPACRFFPRCSDYGAAAIHRYGLARGVILILRRILRCHPWCRGGFDPVP